MFGTIFSFELRRLLRSLSTYIYFLVLFAVTFFVALLAGGLFKEAKFETGGEKIYANAPVIIDAFFSAINNYVGLIIIVAMIGSAVLKDFRFNTYSMIFTTPLTRFDYLLGRFAASVTVACLVLTGPAFGLMLGYVMPGLNPDRIGEFLLEPYIQTYLGTVVPNTLIFGTIFFAVSLISRDIFVIWLSLVIFFVANGVAGSIFSKMDLRTIAAMADPMGTIAKRSLTRYWSAYDKNHHTIMLKDMLLYNRLLWMGLSVGIWALGYSLFSFSSTPRRLSLRKARPIATGKLTFVPVLFRKEALPQTHPVYTTGAMLRNLWGLAVNECKTLLRNVYFQIILLFGLLFLFLASLQLGQIFETVTFPVTYQIVEGLGGTFQLFIVILTIMFGGEIVWRARDNRMSNILDALPVPNWVFYLSKLAALMFMQVILLTIVMVAGILIQLSKGYTHLEIGVYLQYLYLLKLPDLWMLAVMTVFIQTLVHNKFLGHFIVALFYFWNSTFAFIVLKHSLFVFSSDPGIFYSDMNKFGHLVYPFVVFKIYWGAFCLALAALSSLLWARGSELRLKLRWKNALNREQRRSWMLVGVSLVIFVVCGGFIYYNTNTLNHYKTSYQREEERVTYEKKYKRYDNIPQPKITDVKLNVDLFPYKRGLHASGEYTLLNKTHVPIDSVHVILLNNIKINSMSLSVPAKLVLDDTTVTYRIYQLAKPLLPGDSVQLSFNVDQVTKGFTMGFTGLSTPIYNGTFVNNRSFLPSIGYNNEGELSDNSDRKKHGLGYRRTSNPITDTAALQRNVFFADADFVGLDVTVSTVPDQVAVAPGYLLKDWTENGRRYFHYKMDSKILNFYSFLSARYKIKRDKWHDTNIEIYYQEGHEYNLNRMIASIKKALDYYTTAFSPYQHRQIRILEFPRYSTFAQSFPNTIPFSEGIGFIADVDADKENVDYPFYVTAHEVAHQWFAHQVTGADVEGSNLLSESLAQYGAISVLEKEYGEERLHKFLKIEMDNYLRSRSSESEKEKPWAYADAGQGYILYQKGGINMHAFSKYIGADSVNLALKRFIAEYGLKGAPYPTSRDLMAELRKVCPDSLQYLITDAFEKITLYDNAVKKAEARKDGKGYITDITVSSEKMYADSTGKETKATGSNYVEIAIYKDRKTVEHRAMYKLPSGETKLSVPVPEKPYKVVIDPGVLLIDKQPDNNELRLESSSTATAGSKKKSSVKEEQG